MKPHDQLSHDELGEGWTDCYELASDPQSLEAPRVVKCVFGTFDQSQPFGGVPYGSTTLWCGEMKAGKSRLVLALCAGYAFHGARVAYLMGEMSPEEHFERLVMMSLQLTTEELRDGQHADARQNAVAWLRDSVGRRLKFKAVPITLEAITKAAEWAGEGGVVVVDSVQRVQLAQRASGRADEIETAMSHIVTMAQATRCAFHVLSEVAQAPKDGERNAHQWTKHSSSPRQNCDASYIVHGQVGGTQRIENLDRRRGQRQDFTLVLSQRNWMPMLPMWEGGGA